MGIPHLLGHLQPYAVETPLPGTSVVVDGPSLAYHVWHLCSQSQDAQPSHGLLVKTTIAWLEALQSHGADIKAIYFDGFLPPSKRPVRMDRLFKMAMKLQHLHQSNPAACPAQNVVELDANAQVDFRKASDKRREPAHTPAFLVPAVIDGLRAVPAFEPLVRLVPGEADVYCAQHVYEEGGCVITTDSDLLVHDLGSGSVIMFWSIEMMSSSNDSAAAPQEPLSTLRFSPADIAKKLKISPLDGGMLRFGYELSQNPNSSLSKTVEMCRKPIKKPRAYAEFAQPYAPLSKEVMQEAVDFAAGHGRHLDPRVSELVLQSDGYTERFLPATFRESRRKRHPGSPEAPLISLPLLLDSSTHASAWQETEHLRILAYTILHAAYSSNWPFIREFRRVQSSMTKGTRVDFANPDPWDIVDYLLSYLDPVADKAIPDQRDFILVAEMDFEQGMVEKESPQETLLPTLTDFVAEPRSSRSPTDWSLVHITAQLQALYYSWRLISQIISVVLPSCPEGSAYADSLRKLQAHLRKLPPLTEYPTPSSTIETMYRLKADKLMPMPSAPPIELNVVTVAVAVPGADTAPELAGAGKNKKKRKSQKKSAGAPAAKNPRISKNPFDLLGEE